MNSQFDIFYEIVDPATEETELVLTDRFMAEVQYGKGYTVYEMHRTITKHSSFNRTITYSSLQWSDNPALEETYNENDTDVDG